LKAILDDATGQVTAAVSKQEWYSKWGKHYLLSLAMAHDAQICNNFKDPGVQRYATTKFETLRNQIADIFDNIPPPKASLLEREKADAIARHIPYHSQYVSTQSMSQYNTVDNGCFSGSSQIWTGSFLKYNVSDLVVGHQILVKDMFGHPLMHKIMSTTELEYFQKKLDITTTSIVWVGNLKSQIVKNIDVGDYVLTLNNDDNYEPVKVTHVLRTLLDKPVDMVLMNMKCAVTLWHPVFNDRTKEWVFAKDLFSDDDTVNIKCDTAMYDFVLESNHNVMIGNIKCITLGHDLVGPVVSHPYFGSHKVVDDLNSLSDKQNGDGYVTITQEYFHRDPITRKICGIYKPERHSLSHREKVIIRKWQDLSTQLSNLHKANNKVSSKKRKIDNLVDSLKRFKK
jgi:hypothetical protein